MTGRELIQWIQDNHAENLIVLVEHRDSGGSYHTAERIGEYQEPALCDFRDELYGQINTLVFNTNNPTAIVL